MAAGAGSDPAAFADLEEVLEQMGEDYDAEVGYDYDRLAELAPAFVAVSGLLVAKDPDGFIKVLHFPSEISTVNLGVLKCKEMCYAWWKEEDVLEGLPVKVTPVVPIPGLTRAVCVVHAERGVKRDAGGVIHIPGSVAEPGERKKMKTKIVESTKADLELLKNQPFPEYEADAQKLMFFKWREQMRPKQKQLALSFAKGWGYERNGVVMCRTSLNRTGGLPNDNNGLEATNSAMKQSLNFQRFTLTTFIPKMRDFVTEASMEDQPMAMVMHGEHGLRSRAKPPAQDGQHRGKELHVWDSISFKTAHDQHELYGVGGGVFACHVQYTLRAGKQAGTTVLVIPSRRILQLLKDQYKIVTVEGVKHALLHTQPCKGPKAKPPCSCCRGSWLDTYLTLYTGDTPIVWPESDKEMPQLRGKNIDFDRCALMLEGSHPHPESRG